MTSRPALLVLTADPAADVIAAQVLERLNVPTFGVGGRALEAGGTERVAEVSDLAVDGPRTALAHSPQIAAAVLKLVYQVQKRRPRAALLVGYSELNARLGPQLRRRGVQVLWYGAPDIWASRPARAAAVRSACDRLAVVLPFEQDLWRSHGVDAHYVGHPALERPPAARAETRQRHGLTPYAEYLALLPGSKPEQLELQLRPMLQALALVRSERGAVDARVILTPWLDTRARLLALKLAQAAGVPVLEGPAPAVLPAFDVALAASGSVTLECAVAGVPPIIVSRSGALRHLVSRRLAQMSYIGLPNLLMRQALFPELLQERVTPESLAEHTSRLLEQRADFVERCRKVRGHLLASLSRSDAGDGHSVVSAPLAERPSERVARLLEPWLG